MELEAPPTPSLKEAKRTKADHDVVNASNSVDSSNIHSPKSSINSKGSRSLGLKLIVILAAVSSWQRLQTELKPYHSWVMEAGTFHTQEEENQLSARQEYEKKQELARNSTSTPKNNNTTSNRKIALICWMGVMEDWPEDVAKTSLMQDILLPLGEHSYEIRLHLVGQNLSQDLFPAFREPYSMSIPSQYEKGSFYVNATFPMSQRADNLYSMPITKHARNSVNLPQYRNESIVPLDPPEKYERVAIKMERVQRDLEKWFSHTGHQQDTSKIQYNKLSVNYYKPLINPPIPLEYLKNMIHRDALVPRQRDGKRINAVHFPGFARVLWRNVNDMRLLHSQAQCGAWLAQEMADIQHQEIIVIKLGEDTTMTNRIPLAKILGNLLPQQLITVPAHTTRGHDNDQVEILKVANNKKNVQSVLDYFFKPYEKIYQTGVFRGKVSLADYQHVIAQNLKLKAVVAAIVDGDTNQAVALKGLPKSELSFSFEAKLKTKHPIDGYPLSSAKYRTPKTPWKGNSNSNHSNETSMSAFVCITGQMARLELDNKVHNLLRPMYDSGGYSTIDVVLVLSLGDAIFRSEHKPEHTNITFASEQDIWDYLGRPRIGDNNKRNNETIGSFLNNVQLRYYKPDPRLPVNPQYAFQKVPLGVQSHFKTIGVMKDGAPVEGLMEVLDLTVLSNTRMMQAYRQCYKDGEEKPYDLFIRIREDIGFDGIVNPDLFNASNVPPNKYLTHRSRNWRGINDRMAFFRGGPNTASCYFHLPFIRMFDGKTLSLHNVNTERHFKFTYEEAPDCIGPGLTTKSDALFPHKMMNGGFID